MKKITFLLIALMTSALSAQTVFINEIHYDNTGTDSGEAIEIAGTAGTDVSSWSIVLYNGSNGNTYGSATNFSGTLTDQNNGFGTASISYPTNGIQNGSPDGIALINNVGAVVQFISYEGTLTANNGPAAGMMSTDIGINEPGSTAVGTSLQLTGGPGSTAGDFMWVGGVATSFGAVNAGQTFAPSMVACDISCPMDINTINDPGMMTAVVTYTDPTLSGDCTVAGFTQTAGLASGAAFPIGVTTNTFTAVDDNDGTVVTCSFNVTVSEVQGPDLSCMDIDLQLDATGTASITTDDVSETGLINGYALDQTGAFAPMDIAATGNNVGLGDDSVSGALPIGFTFSFFGNDFTNFFISSNGFITFVNSGGSGCCSGQSLPNSSTQNNLIAFAWEDLDPGNGGQPGENVVRYETLGAAPNRVLVMEFFNVDHFPNNNNVTSQVQLHEGSNRVEIHTTSMPSDGGNHTMGIENADGSLAVPVPGRNRTSWSASNDFVSFTPVTVSLDVSSFDCTTTGDQTVTVTASTDDGGISTCTSTVNVIPAVDFTGCPVDIFTGTGSGVCSAIINFTTPTATSICGTPVITQTAGPESGSAFPVGETLVEFTADINGVPAFCSFVVTVTDTDLPTITDCPGDIVVGANEDGNYAIEDYTAATDNCSSGTDIVVTQEPAVGTVVTEGTTTTVTVTATDAAGNEAICTFDLTVDSSLGLGDLAFSNALSLYPNPTVGAITLRNSSAAIIDAIQIVDVNGRVLASIQTEITNETRVDFSKFATGVYFMQITSGANQVVKRIVKQ